ncbi:transcriptional regulator, partial [Streptomyces griseofuscus]
MTTTEAGATAPSEQTECGEHATHGYHKQKDEHLKRLR